MPSPLGHALAGATIAWLAHSVRRTPLDARTSNRLAITCAELAVAPDLDFIYQPVHRMMSHSITAVVLVGAIAGLIARRADRRAGWPVAVLCGLAYGSHLALDWLGTDTNMPSGIQLLWPFSDHWFISSWSVFGGVTVHRFLIPETMLSNAMTVVRELFILGPIAVVAWVVQRRAVPKT